MTLAKAWRRPKPTVSPAELRAEGVVEIGRAADTSLLYVLTSSRLRLFHVGSVPDRVLDPYAVELAVNWIECGVSSAEIARNLGVNESTLQHALSDSGYERIGVSRDDGGGRRSGNRRGRLVRRSE